MARRRTVAGAHRGVVRRYGHVHARRRACPIPAPHAGRRHAVLRDPRSCRSRPKRRRRRRRRRARRRRVLRAPRLAAPGPARRRAAVARAGAARGEVVPGGVLRAARRGRHDAPRAAGGGLRRALRRAPRLRRRPPRRARPGAPGGAGGLRRISVRAQLPSRARARRGHVPALERRARRASRARSGSRRSRSSSPRARVRPPAPQARRAPIAKPRAAAALLFLPAFFLAGWRHTARARAVRVPRLDARGDAARGRPARARDGRAGWRCHGRHVRRVWELGRA